MFYRRKTPKITLAGTRKICFWDESKNVMYAILIYSSPESKPSELSGLGTTTTVKTPWTQAARYYHNRDLHALSQFRICLVILHQRSSRVKPSHYKRITHKTASLAIPSVISLANWYNPIKHHVAPTLKYLLRNKFQLKKCTCPPSFSYITEWPVLFSFIGAGDC